MRKILYGAAVAFLLLSVPCASMAAGSRAPANLYSAPPAGVIGAPSPTMPKGTAPELPGRPAPPAIPAVPDYRGAVDPRTGHFYPSQGNGVFNPQTGEFYPRSGSGFINPRTGAFYPGVEKGGAPDSPVPVRP